MVIASLEDSIQDAIDAMGHKDIRHLPVSDPNTNEIVGLLSISVVAKALAESRSKAFRMLEDIAINSTMPIHVGFFLFCFCFN